MVAASSRFVFALDTKKEVEARWGDVTDTLADRCLKAAESMRVNDPAAICAIVASSIYRSARRIGAG